MARLRTAMDSAFWDMEISTPQLLEGVAKSIPGEPFPMETSRNSKALRIQQLGILKEGFPLGLIPSYSPPSSKGFGSFSLQSLLLSPVTSMWSLGLTGQFRPKKLFSSIKSEFMTVEDVGFSFFKDVAKHFLDKSLYAFNLSTQFAPTPTTWLKWSAEQHGDKEGRRQKLALYQQLPEHEISLEAAWPQLFIDHKGQYWDVPESISLDLLSLVSESGLRYRFGLHKNSGHPVSHNSPSLDPPPSLMPGLCAKAAFSYEKSRDFWRKELKKADIVEKTIGGYIFRPSYDCRLSEAHSAISGIIGGTFAAWFTDKNSVSTESEGREATSVTKSRSPVSADLFGSVCYTFQHGHFQKFYHDLTRLDARLDICSASAFAKKYLTKTSSSDRADDPSSHPRLNFIFQQQVAGPIVARLDSRILLGSTSERKGPYLEDVILSLTYSFRFFESGKAVFWYSPKRKEGMVEFRLFEF